MNITAIRQGLADAASTAGFNPFSWLPADLQSLPAAVAGGVENITRLNRAHGTGVFTLTLYASLEQPKTAAEKLDAALSVGVTGSVLDVLDATSSPAWTGCHLQSAGPYQVVIMPSGFRALSVDLQFLVAA